MNGLSRWLLGADRRQRVRASQTLLALAVYAVFAAVQHGEVLLGFIDARESALLTAFNIVGALCFYLLIRTGANLRLGRDPALTAAQCAFACVGIVISYAITGPARGAVIGILILVLVFGLFALSTTQARRLAVFAVVLLAVAMLWKSQTDALRYPPGVELVHFFFAVTVLSAVAVLASRLGALRARLNEQNHALQDALRRIESLALHDELTGLYNRRHMMAQLEQERVRAARTGQGFCVALLDIDHFKRVNDRHGHAVGDEVLRAFAAAGLAALRDADVLARWGGEEFLVLMPATLLPHAAKGIERLRALVAASAVAAGEGTVSVTVSAGLIEGATGETVRQLVDRADQALYDAKAQGRDRLVIG
jgi:diguanylate cyclase (GGDEF)-like protein